jgi:YHS domain-containing protein
MIVLQGCKDSGSEADEDTSGQKWTCPKHPDIIETRPVKCRRCGTDLVPVEPEKEEPEKKEPGAMLDKPTKDIILTAEQTTCPIMDAPVNKNIFVEYKGKKVYFCCPGCEDKFEANPQQYIAKLPQFNN